MRALVRWGSSIALRQALGHALLVVVTMAILLLIVYQQTVGAWRLRIDREIDVTTRHLVEYERRLGPAALAAHINALLGDGIASDTEIYALITADGRALAGNLSVDDSLRQAAGGIGDRDVVRAGRPSHARLCITALQDGALLVVGRDMQDQRALRQLMRRASVWAAAATVLLAAAGALILRRQLEQRIGGIRRTAHEIERGDLARRVPISPHEDEFARLSRDINAMLDRIHDLMEGVRHVSNTIAHNIRTPLARAVARLATAQQAPDPGASLPAAVESAIGEIQDLNSVLEKLLRIAEVESGTRRQAFTTVSLNAVVVDALDLYGALAEARGLRLTHAFAPHAMVEGDADLLANAVANLLDNAIKFSPPGGSIHVDTRVDRTQVMVAVRDRGPGIAPQARESVGIRFYRVDRTVPGWGLGLASVRAIAQLHGGSLQLLDGAPGLEARLIFPAPADG
ncbi:MAG: HAMP domain-containing protein [Proteobacteria bacterium]|nr:HAMP domain-containing protein [Pseudomonadota bacterium]